MWRTTLLSDNFKTLLNIQEDRLITIRRDCYPFTEGQIESASVHQRVVKDVDDLLSLIHAFRDANPTTTDDKKDALRSYSESSKISMELSAYLFTNSQCAGPFRNRALQDHAIMLNTIAREQVLTCVTTAWALLEEYSKNIESALTTTD